MAVTPVTGLDVVKGALLELGVLAAGEEPEGSVADFVLAKGNRLIDNWNAKQQAIFAVDFLTFTLVAGTQPLTIGPAASTPTFTVTQRPVSIDAANVIITNNIRVPLTVHTDPQWWMSVQAPAVQASLSSDLYYNPGWPLGQIYLWCLQSYPYTLELLVRQVLAELAFATNLAMPQGYWDALILTLAEDCATPLKVQPKPLMLKKAAEARAQIFANNTVVPTIQTAQPGMVARGRGRRSNWNWLSGSVNGRFGGRWP